MNRVAEHLSQVNDLIEKQLRLWNHGAKKPKTRYPVITISREHGSLGSKIAKQLAKKLGFSFWDQNIVHIIAKNSGLNQTLTESLDEKSNSMIDDLITGIMLGKEATERGYIEQLLKAIHTINKHKNAVIVGRGSQFILKDTAFKIRIVSPEKTRVKTLQKNNQQSEKQAKEELLTTDKERISFHQKHFQANITNPIHYNICLNSTGLEIDQAVEFLYQNYQLFLQFKEKK
jgi:CMP/dCMP kinase